VKGSVWTSAAVFFDCESYGMAARMKSDKGADVDAIQFATFVVNYIIA
jgi:hypothetical protein